MRKSRYVYNFFQHELKEGFAAMELELRNIPVTDVVWQLYKKAKSDFIAGKFSYDGPTFVKARNHNTIFEVAAFIHDWRNSMGYVGYDVDREMLSIMVHLNYPVNLINERWLYTRLTFLNILRHKLMRTYIAPRPEFIFNQIP